MSRKDKLRRLVWLCCCFPRNLAYYRAGWDEGCKQLLDLAVSANVAFWRQVNSNSVDMCVLEWCKLFAEAKGKFYWANIVSDPTKFKKDLLCHLGLTEDAFRMELKDMRALRDKHIAHSDDVVDGYVPILDVAKKATWFYHDHVVSLESNPGDLAALPLNLESGYMECETEARAVYRRNLRT